MFYISKTTEFPDMLNCFIKKMFQSPVDLSRRRCADLLAKQWLPDAGKTTEILYICLNENDDNHQFLTI